MGNMMSSNSKCVNDKIKTTRIITEGYIRQIIKPLLSVNVATIIPLEITSLCHKYYKTKNIDFVIKGTLKYNDKGHVIMDNIYSCINYHESKYIEIYRIQPDGSMNKYPSLNENLYWNIGRCVGKNIESKYPINCFNYMNKSQFKHYKNGYHGIFECGGYDEPETGWGTPSFISKCIINIFAENIFDFDCDESSIKSIKLELPELPTPSTAQSIYNDNIGLLTAINNDSLSKDDNNYNIQSYHQLIYNENDNMLNWKEIRNTVNCPAKSSISMINKNALFVCGDDINYLYDFKLNSWNKLKQIPNEDNLRRLNNPSLFFDEINKRMFCALEHAPSTYDGSHDIYFYDLNKQHWFNDFGVTEKLYNAFCSFLPKTIWMNDGNPYVLYFWYNGYPIYYYDDRIGNKKWIKDNKILSFLSDPTSSMFVAFPPI